ncbi:MAG: sulfite exporter TauE/SafE family protein [Flavobacterium sp.]|nr:sulfite exporter TauE/SafE family protein [Flavobacterium sp.]
MLFTAILFGLLSSLHCVGMCGPIALMLPTAQFKGPRKWIRIGLYHFGRLSAYTSIGLLFGLIGHGLYLAGLQQKLAIGTGIAMILVSLISEKHLGQFSISKPIFKLLAQLKSAMGAQFKKRSFSSFFSIGFLNGFLPCGMVYVALFGAIAMQTAVLGGLYMLLFGLGTLPLMGAVSALSDILSIRTRQTIQRYIPIMAIALGILFIIRGLGLGIPYVSPAQTSLFIQQHPTCHQ